jgi:4'-phosphopantetheinyl transferase EntD
MMAMAVSAQHARITQRELSAALRSIAPPGVDVGCRQISSSDIDDLDPLESALVERAGSTRRSEFATGRSLLRSLLAVDVPIPSEPTGAPQLPPGSVGSLAHDREWVVAASSRQAEITALGIDIEPEAALTPAEAAIIVSAADDVQDPLLAFVQKEAVYKAWSSLGGRMLEHHEVAIRSASGTFSAVVAVDGRVFTGRHTTIRGRHLAIVVVSSPAFDQAAG